LLVTAARKVRRTPGWPFVVGAALGVGFAVASGLTRGEAERAFLAFFPWLLVPSSAPDARPAERGESASAPVSVTLVALGAVSAIVVEAVLRSPW
jgi:methylthioxylose transferase